MQSRHRLTLKGAHRAKTDKHGAEVLQKNFIEKRIYAMIRRTALGVVI